MDTEVHNRMWGGKGKNKTKTALDINKNLNFIIYTVKFV